MANARLDAVMASDLLKKIQKTHGKTILTKASDYNFQRLPRIPSGIFQLDYALGGGWPAGRVNVSYGMKSTGKTSLFLRGLANAQKLCANCWTSNWTDEDGEVHQCRCGEWRDAVIAFLDVEGTWDAEWAARLGVDPDNILLSVPDYAEQTLDIGEALIRSGEVDVLVIDSIAFLTPSKEIEESSGKALQAEQARTLGRGVRKFVSAINYCGNQTGRRPTLFFTNQIRMKIGMLFGNPETTPGGFAPGFAATTEVKTFGGTGKSYQLDDVTGRPLHVDLKFRVEKNKSAGAKMEGEYRMILADTEHKSAGSIYDENFMLGMAIKIGLVEKEGNGWACLGEKYRKKDMIEEKLVIDPLFKHTFGETLMSVLMAG